MKGVDAALSRKRERERGRKQEETNIEIYFMMLRYLRLFECAGLEREGGKEKRAVSFDELIRFHPLPALSLPSLALQPSFSHTHLHLGASGVQTLSHQLT